MVAQLILEFEGVTEAEYDAVNEKLGLSPKTGEGDWPDGMLAHAAGLRDDGLFVVTEVWDTPEHQARFMEGRLGQALEQAGVPAPVAVSWIELIAHHAPGSG